MKINSFTVRYISFDANEVAHCRASRDFYSPHVCLNLQLLWESA